MARQNSTFHKRVTLVVSLIGFALTLFAYAYINHSVNERNELRLTSIAQELRDQLLTSVNVITYGLGGANGIFAASQTVERREFRDYVESRNLSHEFPGVYGFAFSQVVPRQELESFVEAVRKDDKPEFEVKTSGDNSNLLITKFIEPEEVNRPALGFDIGSDPARRAAAEKAMLSGMPVLSKKLQLLQDSEHQAGFLYLKPVYKKEASILTPEERRRAIYGFVFAPFTLEKVLEPLLERYGELLSISVFEGDTITNALPVYSNISETVVASKERDLPILVGQQPWVIKLQANSAFLHQQDAEYLPITALVVGWLITFITSIFTWMYLEAKHRNFTSRIKAGEQFIQGILDSANFSIIVTEPNGIIRVFNKAAARMLGYEPEEIIGKFTPGLIHDSNEVAEQAEAISKRLNREIKPGFEVFTAEIQGSSADEKEWVYIRKDGSRFPVSLSATAMRDEKGEVVGYMGIANDISIRKKSEAKLKEKTEELIQAKIAAENAAKSKSQFLANMSHEIRTPLTSIIGYSESLMDDELSSKERHLALETVIKNGNHLLGVINDILDLSKIEAGKTEVEITPVTLADLLSDVANLMQPKAHERGLSLGFDYTFPIPRRIQTDPIRLKQILINLVGNAVKFTTVGGVKI